VTGRHDRSPLGATTVERLCKELSSVAGATHKAIVCSAGYAGKAIVAARSQVASLLAPRQLTQRTPENHTRVMPAGLDLNYLHMSLLYWCRPQLTIHVSTDDSFEYLRSHSVFSSRGDLNSQYPTWAIS